MMKKKHLIYGLLVLICLGCTADRGSMQILFEQAHQNGILANEGFRRCTEFMNAWLEHADPATGLIPRNLFESDDIWNAQDAAADNYPFMVLTSAITSPDLFKGTMQDMLSAESSLTPRLGRMPDTYSFSKQDFESETIDTASITYLSRHAYPVSGRNRMSHGSDPMLYSPHALSWRNIRSNKVSARRNQLSTRGYSLPSHIQPM